MREARINAATPMTGGMIWPPVEATASTAPAKLVEYPFRFIIGMVWGPSTATFAATDPEIMPKSALDQTDVWAAPDAKWEQIMMLSFSKNFAPPTASRSAPKRRKWKMTVAEMPVRLPRVPMKYVLKYPAILAKSMPE